MPPASRGFTFLHILRRYATTPIERPSKLPTKLPAGSRPHETLDPPRKLLAPKAQARQNQLQLEQSKKALKNAAEAPQSPERRILNRIKAFFTTPSSKPPLLERILEPFDPRIGRVVRFAFRTLPWIPPILFLHLHLPFQIMWVNGPSMSPFLNTNYSNEKPNTQDLVFVDRYFEPVTPRESAFGTQRLERGMVVVFNTPHKPGRVAVKRIVGLPGDRVQSMPGYSDELEDPPKVVVPWNHIWVEGDADDRTKSVDSNWYGPISKCLVIGQVKAVLSPWYFPTSVHWQDQTYPAKKRVEENAVRAIDPGVADQIEHFRSGTIEASLDILRQNPQRARNFAKTSAGKREMDAKIKKLQNVEAVAEPEIAAMARSAREELEAWLYPAKAQKVAEEDLEKLVTG